RVHHVQPGIGVPVIFSDGECCKEWTGYQGTDQQRNYERRVDTQKPSPEVLLDGAAPLQAFQHEITTHDHEAANNNVGKCDLPGADIREIIYIMSTRQIITVKDDDQGCQAEADDLKIVLMY